MARRGELQHERGVVRYWHSGSGVIARDNGQPDLNFRSGEPFENGDPVGFDCTKYGRDAQGVRRLAQRSSWWPS